ncbi:hypothetical protein D3C71_1515030 [compost metagenome]
MRRGGGGRQRGQRVFPAKSDGRAVGVDHLGLELVGMALEEHAFHQMHQRHIEHVHPVAILAAVARMRVPGPARRQQHVAGTHLDARAVDHGVGALAFQDDAQRIGRVAVGVGRLAGLDQLVGRDHGAHGGIEVALDRIGHGQVAPVRHGVVDQMAGSVQDRLDVGVAPAKRHEVLARLGPQRGCAAVPAAFHTQAIEGLVQGFEGIEFFHQATNGCFLMSST